MTIATTAKSRTTKTIAKIEPTLDAFDKLTFEKFATLTFGQLLNNFSPLAQSQ